MVNCSTDVMSFKKRLDKWKWLTFHRLEVRILRQYRFPVVNWILFLKESLCYYLQRLVPNIRLPHTGVNFSFDKNFIIYLFFPNLTKHTFKSMEPFLSQNTFYDTLCIIFQRTRYNNSRQIDDFESLMLFLLYPNFIPVFN